MNEINKAISKHEKEFTTLAAKQNKWYRWAVPWIPGWSGFCLSRIKRLRAQLRARVQECIKEAAESLGDKYK